METAFTREADIYWHELKGLSKEVKLDLISRLSASLLHKEIKRASSAKKFYGIWKDSIPSDADELAKEIRKARQFKNEIEAF